MTPEEARLALEAARKAGHVGQLAWDKLCLYYQTEAVVVLICMVWAHAALSAAVIFCGRKPWYYRYTAEERRHHLDTGVITRWSLLGVLAASLWVTAAIHASLHAPSVIATVAVPELKAAMAVARFAKGGMP